MEPYSIIAAPFRVWIAPTGTAFPLIDAEPAVAWALLGENGTRSMDEDGVTVTHGQTVNEFRAAGSTGPIKAARAEEELVIAFNLIDLTLEAYSKVLNGNTVTDTAPATGVAGIRSMGLSRGFAVNEFAMLIRGEDGPYGPGFAIQYEVPRVYESASAAPQFTKGAMAVLACEFRALEDLDATSEARRFGRLVAQDAAAT